MSLRDCFNTPSWLRPAASVEAPRRPASAILAVESPVSAWLPSTLSLGLGPTERVLKQPLIRCALAAVLILGIATARVRAQSALLVWEEAPAGSASGGGISNNSGESYCPAVGRDAIGNLLIAW